jgi:glutamyl-tRNA(Gln) amidotransferase subunit E
MAENAEADKQGVRPPGDFNPRREPVLDFRDRPLSEMSRSDYEAIGFLSGLEVHQQLLTRSKLFCRCPAGHRVTRVDAEVLRHMRPTLSELGEYDGTALMEFKTRKEIVYLLERGTVCTYEMDDTPPFHIDDEAVRIAVELAMLCNLNLVSELHVMRKQYLDGSIPTGFQRTAMVGLTGSIPLRIPELGVDRELSIRQLSLEEDSCREVSDLGHRITFRTDRLGVPLTELVTEPELLTPQELQAGARLLADTARATGKVRRGAGAARQDVNVSVAGGRRVEIKGVPQHRGLPLLVHTEAFRQLNLLRVRAELARRGVTPDMLPDPGPGHPWQTSELVLDAGPALRTTLYRPLRQALDRGETACAVRLPGFARLLGHPTQPGVTFARELADRVRVIACPRHHPFMTHSGRDDIGAGPWRELAAALRAGSEDAIVVAWAPRQDAVTAAREILLRAREALDGVPAETRQAFADGTTGFERVLPGPDRMYPDTDTPPLPIPDTIVAEVQAGLAETPWDRQDRYQRLGLDARSARQLAVAPWADLFDQVAPRTDDVARRLAATLQQRIPFHVHRGRLSLAPDHRPEDAAPGGAGLPSADRIAPLVRALEQGKLLPDALIPAFDDLVEHPERSQGDTLAAYRPVSDDDARLRARIHDAAREARALIDRPRDVKLRWAMGQVMRPFRGRVDPVQVQQRLALALAMPEEEVAS